MLRKLTSGIRLLLMAAVATGAAVGTVNASVPRLVTASVNDAATVELVGNTRPEATSKNDRGRVDDSLQLDHLQLLLNRPAETEAALVHLIDELHDSSSPLFHQWLTAEQLGTRFGPAEEDIKAVTDWLERSGFTVNFVHPSGRIVDFSGTAGQVRTAFHTEIHELDVGGVSHIANMTNPRIPVALAAAVNGVVALHDFMPHKASKAKPAYTFPINGFEYYAVVPADLATIYNLKPLFAKGITGKGETVVVIEDTNVYSTADWTLFRKTFGLSQYTDGKFTQVFPAPASGKNNCTPPGVVAGNEVEAEIDAEWASAAAPNATIELAACKDTRTTFGGLIALENLLNEKTPPPIVSISYGECEAFNGATSNAAYSATYQQGVAEGTSIYVSSGDEGAASCDADQSIATHGIGVSAFTSTPYDVSVGGTDFGDSYANDNSTYWSSTNGKTYGSALSYINEIPWNDSCAGSLLASYEGYSKSYGSTGFCNSSFGEEFLSTGGGSGGPSGCATGAPSKSGVVSGSCAGYTKPSWQKLLGNPSDGVRDIPDVSLFAANGLWGHFYLICDSDASDGLSCTAGSPNTWAGYGGTSFASPIWAGFQALINQKTGSKQGNPNPTLYKLAAAEYGSSGSSTCNSTSGNAVGKSCVFYDVTQGDMDVNCTGTNSCYLPSGSNGVLSTSDKSFSPAYGTTTGWDFATGIGTVNVTNLVEKW